MVLLVQRSIILTHIFKFCPHSSPEVLVSYSNFVDQEIGPHNVVDIC